MAHGRFWKNVANVFIITIQLFWLCIIFTFVILPRLIILPFRRRIAKIRTQRKMVKNGMPRKDARIFAKKYRTMLNEYGSIIGIIKSSKKWTRKTDIEEDESEITEQRKILKRIPKIVL